MLCVLECLLQWMFAFDPHASRWRRCGLLDDALSSPAWFALSLFSLNAILCTLARRAQEEHVQGVCVCQGVLCVWASPPVPSGAEQR